MDLPAEGHRRGELALRLVEKASVRSHRWAIMARFGPAGHARDAAPRGRRPHGRWPEHGAGGYRPARGSRSMQGQSSTTQATGPAIFDRRFARNLWRLTRVYWTSSDAPRGGLLLALAIGLELGTVFGNVMLADGQRRIFDALQDKDGTAFFAAILAFLVAVLGFVAASTLRIYARQVLEIRWRERVTAYYLERWIRPLTFCQDKLHKQETDNPDQRIAEDIRDYVASTLGLSLSLLSAVVTLISFGGLLWSLSGVWAVHISGRAVHIPGLMLWVAILYAILATWVTHRIGRPLVPINFDRQRVEADFRFDLVRFRQNVESVAFSRGEDMVRTRSLDRLRKVIENWSRLIRAQLNLNLL